MDKAPMNKLPHELKMDIFGIVLYAEKGVKVTLNKPISSQRKRLSMRTYARQPHPLAIQATCRELFKATTGLVFKVNDSWSFVAMDDDTTAWGKRVQHWCHQIAGKQCLDRARLVQFDIGAWDSYSSRRLRGSISLSLYTQIGAMFQNLPKQLRQCEQNFKLRIVWSQDCHGVKHANGSKTFSPEVILIAPMWRTPAEIKAALNTSVYRTGGRHRRPPTETEISNWATPHGSRQLTRAEKRWQATAIREVNAFIMLSREIDASRCRHFVPDMRERLEEHAFYP
jgi:hypothetical protein